MWVHNLSPDLFVVGPIHIRFYGLVYVFGFLLAYYLLRSALRKGRIPNLTEARLDSYIFWCMIGLVVGARLYHVIVDYGLYAGRPLDMLKIWEGGLAFHGGLIGLALVTWIFVRKYRIAFYDLADAMVLPAALTLGLGRLANFINGELWGTPADVPWCVVFPAADELCRHPSQIYEAAKNFANLGVLVLLNRRSFVLQRVRPPGFLLWAFVAVYGWLRFAVTHFRDDAGWAGTPWPLARWLALLMGIVGLAVLIWKYRAKAASIKPRRRARTP